MSWTGSCYFRLIDQPNARSLNGVLGAGSGDLGEDSVNKINDKDKDF